MQRLNKNRRTQPVDSRIPACLILLEKKVPNEFSSPNTHEVLPRIPHRVMGLSSQTARLSRHGDITADLAVIEMAI